MLVAATDGSCLGNPGPGGWAWVTEDGRESAMAARRTTNNRMELMAVLQLLEAIHGDEDPLIVQTDSAYVVGIFTEWLAGWRERGMRTSRKQPVGNVDLIDRIASALDGRDVRFEKVRGHAGHPLNERADALAQASAQRAARTVALEDDRSATRRDG
jgi:ribonuclease HI